MTYLGGLAWWGAVYGLCGLATWSVLRRRLGGLTGAPRAVAALVLFTAALVAAHVVPLALGVLARGTVVASAAVLAAGGALVPARRFAVAPAPASDPDEAPPLAMLLAGVAVAAVAGAWCVTLARDATHPVFSLDALTFHLPNVARWIQHGTLWRVDQFIPGLAQGNYPQNGDVVTLSAVLPWRDVFAARLVMSAYYALTGLSVYALAREVGARTPDALLAAALVLSVPIVALASVHSALPDPVMYACFAAGLLFGCRHARSRAGADLVLAGLALGLAFGTKWYAVSAVVAAAVVWSAARLITRERAARVARDLLVLAGCIALAGGIWLVRNLVESGNPAFPQEIAPLGITLFGAPPDPIRELAGFRVADYLLKPGVWGDWLLPAYRAYLSAPAALALLALVAAVVRWRAVPSRVAVLAALGLVLVAVYAVTPYSAFGPRDRPIFTGANSRYVIPAVIAGAAVAAWGMGRLGRRAALVAEVVAVLAVIAGLRHGYDAPTASVVLVAVALLAAGWAAARRPRAVPAVAAAAVLLVAAVAAGARVKDRFDARGHRGVEPTIDAILAAPPGTRIGLAGIFDPAAPAPVLPAFGPRLRNDVRYVGPFVRHRLEQYRSAAAFQRALRRGRYALLLIGRGTPPKPSVAPERWAAQAGWTPVARSTSMTLMRSP